MFKPSILIVDDEKAARYGMKKILLKDNYSVYEAKDSTEALHMIKTLRPSLVLLDINMPQLDGMKTLEMINAIPNPPLVVIVTAYGSEKIAVDAMKKGAYDYIAKPYEIDELRIIAKNAFDRLALQEENARLRIEIVRLEGMGELIGQSEAMKEVFDKIEKVGTTDVTVLIQGESGSGKELVAREIHRRSKRRNEPLIIMNCAAVPETLVESELFGHEKGAFTGAAERRLGKFELANKGTIFLDEIGDMSTSTQSKLLRILQEQKFERLGGIETLTVDTRIISATHCDLEEEIEENRFREDLYYRIKVVSIKLPPLRHRKEDIPLLVNRFLHYFSEKHQKRMASISHDAMKYLISYDWPGNVRQLKNALESAVVLSNGEILDTTDLPEEIKHPRDNALPSGSIDYNLTFRDAKKILIENFERDFIKKKLEECDGNISRTAEALDMHRQNLQQKIRELRITKERNYHE
ncbi:Transcriptional regulatory protein ZraR [Candidatus Brocadiaceae bacterium B188]|nr:sigma-54-dependent Fis family transcriptional regulator [Candidatus Brocadia sapporoensis]QQR66887.1 MAG: sigma-54-dependent Fis family transcriptional regulator [Candidatus Brocadia sp.]RZV57836.1 MAG: sigma-54-dependent Fis family transcriptional regulator [Candidatus Brocadia sp. BROELEC01]TWU53866.1 Transcriptional regulatory protein ZraR [Candidatus Brocadiaceae bacterium B188]